MISQLKRENSRLEINNKSLTIEYEHKLDFIQTENIRNKEKITNLEELNNVWIFLLFRD